MKINLQKGFSPLIVIVIVIAVGAVAYFGFVKKSAEVTYSPSPTATASSSKLPSPTPKDETSGWKTYNFDGPVDFSIKYPNNVVGENNGWGVEFSKSNEYMASMALTKFIYISGSKNEYNTYKIDIYQADGGAGSCIFSDSRGPINENFDLDLRNVPFVEISAPMGLLRRYSSETIYPDYDANFTSFHFCSKRPDGSFNGGGVYSTPIGGLVYKLPSNYDSKILAEMDAIIKTIKK